MPTPVLPPDGTARTQLAARLEARLATPVLVAAVMSVPAVFLAAWSEGVWETIGYCLDWGAAAVLWIEWLVLMLVSPQPLQWVKQHKWTIGVALLSIPAVVFTLGPAQLLRLAFVVGTLRILRIRRIITAAQVMNRRLPLMGSRRVVLFVSTSLIAVVFAVPLLADPESPLWRVPEFLTGELPISTVIAVLVVACSTLGVYWWTTRR